MRKKCLDVFKQFPHGPPIAGGGGDAESLGYVYVIGFDEAEIVKIGSARSVGSRLSSLQGGSPFELKLLAAVSVYSDEPHHVEFAAHKLACEFRIRGEWFELGVDDALRAILKAARNKKIRVGSYIEAYEATMPKPPTKKECALAEQRLRVKLGMSPEDTILDIGAMLN